MLIIPALNLAQNNFTILKLNFKRLKPGELNFLHVSCVKTRLRVFFRWLIITAVVTSDYENCILYLNQVLTSFGSSWRPFRRD